MFESVVCDVILDGKPISATAERLLATGNDLAFCNWFVAKIGEHLGVTDTRHLTKLQAEVMLRFLMSNQIPIEVIPSSGESEDEPSPVPGNPELSPNEPE